MEYLVVRVSSMRIRREVHCGTENAAEGAEDAGACAEIVPAKKNMLSAKTESK